MNEAFSSGWRGVLWLEAVETIPTGDVRVTLFYENVHTSTGKTTLGRYGSDDTTDHYNVTLAQQTDQKVNPVFEMYFE